jgi:large conductance mechanosensitive channel
MIQGFKEFIMRSNVVDLAVGVVIGAAFGAVVTSLVTNIITPLVSGLTGLPDFSSMHLTINGSNIQYGLFLNALISFFTIAVAIYFIVVVPMNKVMKKLGKTDPPKKKPCSECLAEVPEEARRCQFCTQPLTAK